MKKFLTCLTLALVSAGAMAAETRPFNLSLTPDIAIYSRSTAIKGLTLSVWGENPQDSLALGIVNGAAGESAGLSIGILNCADKYKGLQWGLVNCTSQDISGWQGGFFFGVVGSVLNYTGGAMTGVQTGVVNYAGRLNGLQLGVVNYADTAAAGAQIGFVNVISQNTRWFTMLPNELAPVMILVNWRF